MPTFLIADDSPLKRMLLQGMLKKHGWSGEIVTATTTEDAMREIDQHPDIGFAFIDYYMPSKNGPAVIAYLKHKNPTARIALVSSADNHENETEAREAGAETAICTSYPADEVEQRLKEVLGEWGAIILP